MLVALGSLQNAQSLVHTLKEYEKASNAKLNLHKSATIHLADTSPQIQAIGNVQDPNTPFRYLGIYLHPRGLPLAQGWYNNQLDQLSKTMASWQKRKLSIYGKIEILNSRLLSKLWYHCYFINFSPTFHKKLRKLISSFIWDNKTPQINWQTLCTPKRLGGLQLHDPKHKQLAIAAWWLQRLSKNPFWADSLSHLYLIRYCPRSTGFPLWATNLRPTQLRFTGFWLHIFQAWEALNGNFDDTDPLTLSHPQCLTLATLGQTPINQYSIQQGYKDLFGNHVIKPHTWQVTILPFPTWGAIWQYLPLI